MPDPSSTDRRVSMRFFPKDVDNLETIQAHLGVRSDTEAVRAALHTYAILIRDGQRLPTVASER